MFCTDFSENSNCEKIHLGHGAPGTIIEMPDRCGPGRYAVVKSMSQAENQVVPRRLEKRAPANRVVYDLTFDYDFRRVPRDLGDTQMRIDFSNEEGYWDSVVASAADNDSDLKKRKRSLEDMRGSHRRWLEEEWRDDNHNGAISQEELDKRWFGTDVLDWLRRVVTTGVSNTVQQSHSINQEVTAILMQEQWQCNIKGVEVAANLDVRVNTKINVATSFGLTIITKLDVVRGLDLSNSFLFFKNKGSVTAGFSLDALASASFTTNDMTLIGLSSFPGITKPIPGLIKSIGPDFQLNARIDAFISIEAHLDANIELANWDTHLTFPVASGDYNPQAPATPNPNGGFLPSAPKVNGEISASGHVTAHLLPTFSFGIAFEPYWGVPNCKINLIADGWVRLHAGARASTDEGGTCPFEWGVDGGASLFGKLPRVSCVWQLGR